MLALKVSKLQTASTRGILWVSEIPCYCPLSCRIHFWPLPRQDTGLDVQNSVRPSWTTPKNGKTGVRDGKGNRTHTNLRKGIQTSVTNYRTSKSCPSFMGIVSGFITTPADAAGVKRSNNSVLLKTVIQIETSGTHSNTACNTCRLTDLGTGPERQLNYGFKTLKTLRYKLSRKQSFYCQRSEREPKSQRKSLNQKAFKTKRESASRHSCVSTFPVRSSSNLLWFFFFLHLANKYLSF